MPVTHAALCIPPNSYCNFKHFSTHPTSLMHPHIPSSYGSYCAPPHKSSPHVSLAPLPIWQQLFTCLPTKDIQLPASFSTDLWEGSRKLLHLTTMVFSYQWQLGLQGLPSLWKHCLVIEIPYCCLKSRTNCIHNHLKKMNDHQTQIYYWSTAILLTIFVDWKSFLPEKFPSRESKSKFLLSTQLCAQINTRFNVLAKVLEANLTEILSRNLKADLASFPGEWSWLTDSNCYSRKLQQEA